LNGIGYAKAANGGTSRRTQAAFSRAISPFDTAGVEQTIDAVDADSKLAESGRTRDAMETCDRMIRM